jgi:hypothetical protein
MCSRQAVHSRVIGVLAIHFMFIGGSARMNADDASVVWLLS